MGYPATKVEGLYRNPMDEVSRFLNSKHKDKYKVYNLCSESRRQYCESNFENRVENKYRFNDHNPPPFKIIEEFCADVSSWLNDDEERIVAVHCKAGKGRTGTMICCYLLYKMYEMLLKDIDGDLEGIDAQKAMKEYDEARTEDKKGVTIPSQRRYITYFSQYLRNHLYSIRQLSLVNSTYKYEKIIYHLKAIRFNAIPNCGKVTQAGGAFVPQIAVKRVSESSPDQFIGIVEKFPDSNVKRTDCGVYLTFNKEILVHDDVLIEVVNKTSFGKEKLFHFWFNTFFVGQETCAVSDRFNSSIEEERNGISTPKRTFTDPHNKHKCSACECDSTEKYPFLDIPLSELDRAYKDIQHKIYPAYFKVRLFLEKCNTNSSDHQPDRASAAQIEEVTDDTATASDLSDD
ncbi:DgyrCDS12048 [Dimorphilus gyrociliatus]|uniref:Phosphatidylinositol 3,4,5-trisphosphate 3-phosphatase and dual-specificity protein phosphatase PTEN n=1 Tax=Dimorphilus gyrociliatus TaxID=2664684 RepID=A0A7I8W8G4_9ANNE|nr:DgyrCDS12048 [Dimorphilus gyrociliatus]